MLEPVAGEKPPAKKKIESVVSGGQAGIQAAGRYPKSRARSWIRFSMMCSERGEVLVQVHGTGRSERSART
jgi:hypothetical protein